MSTVDAAVGPQAVNRHRDEYEDADLGADDAEPSPPGAERRTPRAALSGGRAGRPEPEVVEDLEVDDYAEEQVRGGTSLDCRRH